MTKKGQGIGTPALHLRAVKAYQSRHKAAGLCVKCSRKAEVHYCGYHKRLNRIAARKRMREKYRRLHNVPKSKFRQRKK